MGAKGFRHPDMQLLLPETCQLPAQKVAALIESSVYIMLDHVEIDSRKKQEWKAYLLYSRSPTRVDYPDLMQNLETAPFLSTVKRFIARPGRSERPYSDKGWTFVGTAKRSRAVMKE